MIPRPNTDLAVDTLAIQLPTPRSHHLLAAAMTGDIEALHEVAGWPRDRIDVHRLTPAVAARVPDTIEVPWRRSVQGAAAARWLFLQQELTRVGTVLHDAGIDWTPIKGVDLATRVYAREEDRPTSDLDLLIAPDDLAASREALVSAGWEDLVRPPYGERYLHEEGYAWQAHRPTGPLVELHFRLWGLLPETAATLLYEGSRPDPALPTGGRRLPLASAYVLAAMHHWSTPAPRALVGWWDLARIAAGGESNRNGRPEPDLASAIADRARTLGIQLPIALAAAQAEALWPHPTHRATLEQLTPTLRTVERWVLRRATRHGSDPVPFAAIVLARLLAGRPSRAGWRSITRRIWAHPGIVAQETPEAWSWLRRRAVHTGRGLGFGQDTPT